MLENIHIGILSFGNFLKNIRGKGMSCTKLNKDNQFT